MRLTFIAGAVLALSLGLAACGQTEGSANNADQQATQEGGQTADQPEPAMAPSGTPVPLTNSQIAACTAESLRIDNVTEAEARHEQIGTEVTINNESMRLAAGQTRWMLCSGPSLQERLTALEEELEAANAALEEATGARDRAREAANDWRALALINPEAGYTEANTHKYRADSLQRELDEANGFGWASWLIFGWAVIATVVVFVLFVSNRRRPEAISLTRPAPRPMSPMPLDPEPTPAPQRTYPSFDEPLDRDDDRP